MSKHILKPAKMWVKEKIKNINNELEKENQNNKSENSDNSKVIYLPYKKGIDSFVVPKENGSYEVCSQGLPIPPKKLWLGYGKNSDEYLYGYQQIDKMIEILDDSVFFLKEGFKVLDFGCGAGRMIRWLKSYSDICEIWGTDISSDHIFWANKYLRPPFNFATTTTVPHLPFKDNYFNLIYCGSVFTHIDDLTDAWLLELRRILAPDGRLYFTIQDKNSIELIKSLPEYKNIWLAEYMKQKHSIC
jgi:SAM-dependent methyltransferase